MRVRGRAGSGGLRVALVHDYLVGYGGAEKVLEALHDIWPKAPIFTTFYDRGRMARLGCTIPPGAVRPLLPAWLPHQGWVGKGWTPLYPLLWRALDLRGFDLVISSSSFAAHQVRAAPGAIHVCYCHSPPRFLYGLTTEVDHRRLRRVAPFLRPLYDALRAMDRTAARRVSAYIANSREVRGRIERFYGREATVIYPPVDTASFSGVPVGRDEGYLLTWGRLVASKQVRLIVRASHLAGLPLVVAGSGPEEQRLRQLAGANVRFVRQPDQDELRYLLSGCRAVVFAEEGDFGIVPVEAMAAGKPVIAYQGGGARETVVAGQTGEFFAPLTAEALAGVLHTFDAGHYDPERCRQRAAEFDRAAFRARIEERIAHLIGLGIASQPRIG